MYTVSKDVVCSLSSERSKRASLQQQIGGRKAKFETLLGRMLYLVVFYMYLVRHTTRSDALHSYDTTSTS